MIVETPSVPEEIICGGVSLLGSYVRQSATRVKNLLDIGMLQNIQHALECYKSDKVIEAYIYLLGEMCVASGCFSAVVFQMSYDAQNASQNVPSPENPPRPTLGAPGSPSRFTGRAWSSQGVGFDAPGPNLSLFGAQGAVRGSKIG